MDIVATPVVVVGVGESLGALVVFGVGAGVISTVAGADAGASGAVFAGFVALPVIRNADSEPLRSRRCGVDRRVKTRRFAPRSLDIAPLYPGTHFRQWCVAIIVARAARGGASVMAGQPDRVGHCINAISDCGWLKNQCRRINLVRALRQFL